MSIMVTGIGPKHTDSVRFRQFVVWFRELLTLITKASSLYMAYNNCLDELKKIETEFHRLERATLSEHLAKWSAMDDTPQKDGKRIRSVHIARYKKGTSFILMISRLLFIIFASQDHQHKGKPIRHFWLKKCRPNSQGVA
jgi:hypothetical protein